MYDAYVNKVLYYNKSGGSSIRSPQQIKTREEGVSSALCSFCLVGLLLQTSNSNPEVLCQIHSLVHLPQPQTVLCCSPFVSFSSSLSHMFCIYTLEVSIYHKLAFYLFLLELGLQFNQKLFMMGKGSIYRNGCFFLLSAP